jgi:L-seryl-tRNA(Ser) seleniumtransferase
MKRDGDARRELPSVSALLESAGVQALLASSPREVVTAAVRDAIDAARVSLANAPATDAAWTATVRDALAARERPSLRRVINATGVILHTNLGRAPLAPTAIEAVAQAAAGYTNLEYDLARGERGSRYSHCVSLLRELTGAEDALVVNNGAAALLLALNTLSDGRDAIVSRGELVEIGGSFRIPDIMQRSGARLVEVGTTNRTHLEDYSRGLGAHAGAIVKVHRSNFSMEGFTAEVDVRQLAPLAQSRGAALIHDLGSGLFIDLSPWGLSGEPLALEAVRAGADVITMSGDKLLGGPQAGIILGRAAVISRLRTNPLTRALRVDKLTLAALEATLRLYREPERARREIPTLAMLTTPVDEIRPRAQAIAAKLGKHASVIESEASVGGGAFPAARIPSAAIAIRGDADALEARLRAQQVPVIGRIMDGQLLLDCRSVPPGDDPLLSDALARALA